MKSIITSIAVIAAAAGTAGPLTAFAQHGGHGGMVGSSGGWGGGGGGGGGFYRSSGGSPSWNATGFRVMSAPAAVNRPAYVVNRPNYVNATSSNRFVTAPAQVSSVHPGSAGPRTFNPTRLGERPSFGGLGQSHLTSAGSGKVVGLHPAGTPAVRLGDHLGVVHRPGGHLSPGAGKPGEGLRLDPKHAGNVFLHPTPGAGGLGHPRGPSGLLHQGSSLNRNLLTNITTTHHPISVGPGIQYHPGHGYVGHHANPYMAYHKGWINGTWNGNHHPGFGWSSFGNNGLGWGAGIGVATWGIGSFLNSWGYCNYVNPYYYVAPPVVVEQPVVVAQQPAVYDYSRPLDLQAAPPSAETVEQAAASLDTARAAFRAGRYDEALGLADQALRQTPNDPMLHEFRATCLFALARYDEAATPLYAVLSAGPGWDWTTLAGLYPSIETYTSQLRALEAYCEAAPKAASARFVLAALYMTQGDHAVAAETFRKVVALQPQDRLSAQFVDLLTPRPAATEATATATVAQAPAQPPSPPAPGPAATPPAQPATPPAQPAAPPADSTPPATEPAPSSVPAPNPAPAQDSAAPPVPANPVPTRLLGQWKANPVRNVSITLTLDGKKVFSWQFNDRGHPREFHGEAAFEFDTLALLAADQPPMLGKVVWKDDDHFQFLAIGAPDDDPGLHFGR